MSKKAKELTTDNFSDEISDGVTLVDFWAPWCGPCKQQSPIVDEIADEVGDNVAVTKVNVDDNEDLAVRHEIKSIPTILIFKDGDEAQRLSGPQQKAELLKAVESVT